MSEDAEVELPGRDFSKVSRLSLGIGLAGLLVGLAGLIWGASNGDNRPWMAWLLGFAFWMSVLVGMLLFIMISHIFDAGWSVIIRRQLEHMVSAFPWMGLIFAPLILTPWMFPEHAGMIWKWLSPDYILPGGGMVGDDPLYIWKQGWLDRFWMTFRTVLYFGVFIGLAFGLRKHSFALDSDGKERHVRQMRVLSAIGVFAVGLSATFGAFDWFMSLEYHWFSTMFGVWFFAGAMRVAVAFTIVLCFVLSTRGWLAGIYKRAHRYDLGLLLLAFTVFWAYIAFSQMFLIYQANIPEETFWYNLRLYASDGSYNDWWWVGMSLVVFHFLVPFLFLIFYTTKVSVKALLGVSVAALVFHMVDLYYNILPAKVADAADPSRYDVTGFGVSVFDLSALIGMGGIVIWSFLRSARKAAPIPLRDPRILESIHHHE